MSGERVVLVDGADGRMSAFVEALATFPAEPAWVVIGGFAVTLRLATVHRLTNDVDTVCRDQSLLIELLLADGADRRAAGKVTVHGRRQEVDVDVMAESVEAPLPDLDGERAFVVARRFALDAATTLDMRSSTRCRRPLPQPG
jgi:hypothetical protein